MDIVIEKLKNKPGFLTYYFAAFLALPVYAGGFEAPDFSSRLDRAVSRGDASTVKTLLFFGLGRPRENLMLLSDAVGSSDPDMLKSLLDRDISDQIGKDTALGVAAGQGRIGAVTLLLDHGRKRPRCG